ncbi:MAG TPA: hypothetical protein VFA97_05905 [Gaiellaceae bacterium]|nr:hypothetical protein [Gaiellaceae bacterium]
MAKRIEQSRRHGHHDPRGIALHAVSESPFQLDAHEGPTGTPPTLVLVAGTDMTPTAHEPIATLGT